jgi:hypothetical protein
VTPPRVAAAVDTRVSPAATVIAGWLVPGAGHALQGQIPRAAVFFIVLVVMFAAGIAFGGRLFPLRFVEPLVFLAAVAEWGLGVPRAVALLGGFGDGDVVSITYESGNTFLIVAGLLNALVVLDAFDVATGRKHR